MCDCFHLAFPNWHAPAAGAGRRLRGPEQETEENSVCEEPEIVERERPRPQGSSPVDEFPIEKKTEEDISDLAHKGGSSKKGRKTGFGSLFDKRTSDKMNDTESGESEIIVKTVKEACVEGLVVTGGRKEGIFIKEVKVDSPASKHLSVKEGDQILSATVYFDNVSYEDALQILEHAQPYKMEFCLRRKVEPTTPENVDNKHTKEKDQGQPRMRNQRKMKKPQERISWPKFPSFGKGPRVQFKRSHSTSEAEEHRKLEMSPPTSDTDSPLKSPLKGPDGKDKKKKHKVQLKMKMKGHRSKSVEEPQSSENALVWENQQVEGILEEKILEGREVKMQEILQVLGGAENEVSSKTVSDDAFQSFSGIEMYETHLISLGNTLKTTDISVSLAEGSEMKGRIYQKEKPNIETENQAESTKYLQTFSDPYACDNVVLLQTEGEISQLDNDISKQGIGKDGSERKVESRNAELSMPTLDTCVEVTEKSPKIGNERQLKEKSMFENESYGIRTRGPLADMAISKSHFVSTINGHQYISSDFSEIMQEGTMSEGVGDTKKPNVIFQHKPGTTVFAVDKEYSPFVKTSKSATEANASEFKLPRVDLSGLVTHELIRMTEVENIRTTLPKREDIEIPGIDNKEKKLIRKTPEIKISNIEKMINITQERKIQDPETNEEFNVEDVKVAVSNFPAFKLPEGDITGVLVQREIELKSTLSPWGSPRKISITSTDSSTLIPKCKIREDKSPVSDTVDKNTDLKLPKVEPHYTDEQTSTTVMKVDLTQPQLTDYGKFEDLHFKLPKREDIEIPGMEAIKETKIQKAADLDQEEKPRTKKHGDKKGHEKKSKKPRVNIKGSESTKLDNQTSAISSEFPKLDSFNMNTEETKIIEKQTFKTPNIREVKDRDVQIQEQILKNNIDDKDLPEKTETKFGKTKFKLPSVTLQEFETQVAREEAKISAVDKHVKKAEHNLPKDKIELTDKPLLSALNATDVIKESQPVNVYGRAPDTETEGQGRKFKLPKFEISLPEVKAPRISCTAKKDDDSSVSEDDGKMPVVHSPKAELPAVKHADLPDVDSQITEVKIKKPGFSFPRFGMSKTEPTAPAADVRLINVDMSLPEGPTEMDDSNTDIAISVKDCKDKDGTKFGSPTKFKIPSIRFPHFGVKVTKTAIETSDVDINVKRSETLPHTELKVSEEPISVDIKAPDVVKQKVSVGKEHINMDIQSEAHGSKYKVPKFGVSFPEVKEPKINISTDKAEIDIPEGKVERHGVTANIKARLPEVDSKGLEVKAPTFPVVDVSMHEGSIEVERPSSDVTLSMGDAQQKGQSKFGSPSKFKLPSIDFTKFGTKGSKASVEVTDVDVDVKGPETTLPHMEMKVSEKAKLEVHPPHAEMQGTTAKIKADLPEVDSKEIEVKMKSSGFSFPEIGLGKSEVKASESNVTLPYADVSLSERSIEIERPDVTVEMEIAEQKDQSKFGSPTKYKLPSVSFPKFGTKGRKASVEVSDMDIDVKGPEITLPHAEMKLSAEPLSVDIKGSGVDKEMKPLSVEMKDQDIQMKGEQSKLKFPKFGISLPEVTRPEIGVSIDKEDIDISVPKAKLEVHPPDAEVQGVTVELKADIPEVDSKNMELNMEMKTTPFSFPKIGFSKSDGKALKSDVSLPNVDVPKKSIEMERPTTDVTISLEDTEQKDPTKFKLPSFSFPKFGTKAPKASAEVSDVDVDVKGPELTLPDAEMKLSTEPLSVFIKGPDVDQDKKPASVEIINQNIQMKDQDSKIRLPKFGIRLPEIKGPKIDVSSGIAEIDIPMPEANLEMSMPDVEVQDVTAEIKASLPEVESKDYDMKMKTPGFSFPKIQFSKSDVKVPEGDVSLPNVHVSLPEGSIEKERPSADVSLPMEIAEQKGQSKFGSPTKYKLPSVSFPKFGTKGPKSSVEDSDMDVDIKEPEITLPHAEMKLSAEPLSVDIKGSGVDKEMKPLSVETKDQNIQIMNKESKFKFPKFGISLPEVKSPTIDASLDKIDSDIVIPKAKLEVNPPDAEIPGTTVKVKADLPEVGSKEIEVQMTTPSCSFPKLGFGKTEVKAPEGDVSLPNVDVSLPEGNIEIERPSPDVTISMEDADQKYRSKFGSPTKFKLPSISLPKFGTKGPKASVDVSEVDVDVKGPEITLPDAEIKLSAEPLSVDITGPDVDKEMKPPSVDIKDHDIQTKEKGRKFTLPKFGISLPEVKAPKVDVSLDKTDSDITVPKAKLEVHPPHAEMQGATAKIKTDLPEVESKEIEVKMTTPGFSFPKFGFGKSEVKAPEGDLSLPNVDVSLHEGSIEIERPSTDVSISMEDADQKGRSKFGSPTKFKLPSISFPKFGTKGPKVSVEVPDVDVDVKGPEITLPDAEIKLSAEPLSVDITGPDVDKEMRPVNMEMKDQDIQMKGEKSKFKLPKFGISLPEVKRPEIGVSLDKAEIDISVPKAKVHLPDATLQGVTAEFKADVPEIDSKDIEQNIQIKGQDSKFKLPKFGIELPEVKGPKIDVRSDTAEIDISMPKANLEMPQPNVEVQVVKAEIKASLPEVESKDYEMKITTPGFSFPKIDFTKSDVNVLEGDVSLPNVDVSLPEGNIEIEKPSPDVTISMEDADQKFRSKFGSPTKFKLPSISLPKFGTKGPKASVDVSEVDVDVKGPEITLPDAEIKLSAEPLSVDIKGPEVDKEMKPPSVDIKDHDIQTKEKGRKFTLPKFGISLPEVKGPKVDVSLDKTDSDITVPKAKLEVHPPHAEMQGATAKIKADLPEVESKEIEVKMTTPGFSFPKFGFGKSEVKAPEGDLSLPNVDVSLHEGSIEIERPSTDVSISMEDADQKGRSKFGSPTKFKLPSISFPKFGTKGPKVSVEVPDVDVDVKGPEITLPDAEIKLSAEPLSVDITGPDVDKEMRPVNLEMKDQDIQMKGEKGKFKLPKFGISLPEVKRPEIGVSLDKAEIDISVPKAKVHLPDATLQGVTAEFKADVPEIDSKDIEQNIQIKGQDSKFKLPKFGIELPEVKGPKIDVRSDTAEIDISMPKANLEMPQPNVEVQVVKAEIKASLPEVESKDYEMKITTPGFSFPKIDFTKSDVNVLEGDVSLPNVDVSLPEGNIEIEKPSPDVTISMEDADQKFRSKFGSPTKFKLPSISLPKFGTKGPKASVDVSEVDVDVKGPEITLPDAEIKLSAEPLSVDIKGPEVDKEMKPPSVDIKDHDIQTKEKGRKFTLPRFGISLPEVKGAKVDVSLDKIDSDITVPKAKLEVHPPHAEMQGTTAKIKADLPEVESKEIEVKMTTPGFSFPKFGFGKSEVKAPEGDLSLPNVDVSLHEGSIEIERPSTDVSISMEDADQKGRSKFGSPTKFKLPSISFPKFGTKGPKVSVEVPDVDVDVKEPEITLPDAEVKLSAEPLSVDINGSGVDKEMKPVNMEMKDQDIQMKGEKSKFKLPKFGISLPEVKRPEIGVSLDKAEIDISVPKAKLHLPDAELQGVTAELKADVPEIDSEDIEQNIQIKDQDSKFKLPKFGIRLPEVKGPNIDVRSDVAEIDISIPEANLEMPQPNVEVQSVKAEIKASLPEVESKDYDMKITTPGFSFPKFGFGKSEVKAPEGDVSHPNVDVSLPEGNIEIEIPSPDVTKSMEDADQKYRSKFGSPTKFKLPSISLPKFGTKGPEASVDVSEVDVDIKGPEITLPDAEIKLAAEPLSVDITGPDVDKEMKPPSVDIKDHDIQTKEKGRKFTLPKFGISLPEVKGQKVDVSLDKTDSDITVPKAKLEVHPPHAEMQGATAKIKTDLPEVESKEIEVKMTTPGFSFPKFGFGKSEVKAPEGDLSLPNVDVSLHEGSIEIERPSTDVSISMEDADQKGRSKFGSPTKFKLPSISFPKFGTKGPKASVDVSEVDVDLKGPEITLPDAEIKLSAEPLSVDIKGPDVDKEMKPPSVDIKDHDIQTKDKGRKFTLPKFGISLPEVKGQKVDVSLGKIDSDITVPKAKLEVHPPHAEMQGATAKIKADLPEVESKEIEVKMTTPGFSFPKFGFGKSEVKAPEGDLSLPNVDVSLHEGSIEIERPSTDVSISMEDADQKGRSKFGSPTKFKLPSISFPKFGTKGPKVSVEVPDVDVDIKAPEITLPDAEVKLSAEPLSVDINGSGVDKEMKPVNLEMKDQDIQMKGEKSKFKFPKFGISLPEVKRPEIGVSLDKAEIDISVPKAKIQPPDAELQGVTAELKADVPEIDSKDIEQNIQIKDQDSKFKLPKFGIRLPEVKGPNIDVRSDVAEIDISIPEANLEMPQPNVEVQSVKAEIKTSLPEVESKDYDMKITTPGFSFPKFGFGKSEVKAPEGDVSPPNVDVSLPERRIEIERPSPDVTISMEDADHKSRSKFGSPTKFKLPSISLPKFATKGPKTSVDVSEVDVDVKGPEITLPDAEIKLSAEPLSVDIKGREEMKPLNVTGKDQDIQIKEKASKFKLPKFEISLPDVKGPKIDVGLDKLTSDISTQKAQGHPPDAEVQEVTTDMESGLAEGHSKGPELNIRTSGFSILDKSDVKASDVDVSLPNVDMSLPKGSIEIEKPSTSVTIPVKDAEQKGRSKFGSPTKFKMPLINFPKFGTKSSKASVDVSDVAVDELQISLPDTEMKLSVEPLKEVVKSPETNKEIKPLSVKEKDTDIKLKEKGGKFKFPKFEISLPEVKGPTFDASLDKAEIGIPVPHAKVEIHPTDAEVQSVKSEIKEEMREVDSKVTDIKMKGPGLSFPKFKKLDSKTNIDVVIPELESQVEKPGDKDTTVDNTGFDVVLEDKQTYTKSVKTSSKSLSAKLADVFSGFEVEFNVPTLDEIEETKKKYSDTLKQDHKLDVKGQITEGVSKHEDGEAEGKSNVGVQKQTSKENETFQCNKIAEQSPSTDMNENESKEIFTIDINEAIASPTLSLSSSDAFADVSSALTSDHTGLSLASPTVVKVKYSEPAANAEVSEIHGDIITSKARTEVKSMYPRQPEKVNIPFSSETSSSSADTLKQMSGHIVVSNVQSVSKTKHAAIFTNLDAQTLPSEKATDSISVEETVIRSGQTVVEKHIVKKILGDDKKEIFVTQTIHVFEGDSTAPISDDTASSIQKLKDTVHTEKIKFFEGTESSKTFMSTETVLRHADSSTDENEGK